MTSPAGTPSPQSSPSPQPTSVAAPSTTTTSAATAAASSDTPSASKSPPFTGRPGSSGGVSNSATSISKKSSGIASTGSRPASADRSSTAVVTDGVAAEVVRMAAVQPAPGGEAKPTTEATATPAAATPPAAAAAATATASATPGEDAASAAASPTQTTPTGDAVRYPAASVGLPTQKAFARSLLNLEVKVLTQALGAENQWAEQGDGRVAFCDFTIRVAAPKASRRSSLRSKHKASSEAAANSSTVSDLDEEEDDDGEDEVVILEDTITNDTPFVGENCCIVWNSFEKHLSLCLMYASEEGYAASWSALVALQDKSYPAFRYDLLKRCRPLSERALMAAHDDGSATSPVVSPTAKLEETVLPYAYFIHDRHDPPLGFIEQHALSLSIMEHRHTDNPALFADKDTVVSMLTIANADLLDHLLSDKIYPMLLRGVQCGSEPVEWTVPQPLRGLHVPEEVTAAVAKDRRIVFMQETVLPTCCSAETKAELSTKYATLSRRIRNDVICGLLNCDAVFAEASEALRIAPPVMTNTTTSAIARSRIGSIDSSANTSTASLSSGPAPSPAAAPPLASDNLAQAQRAEQQVLGHLRFFRELFTLSIAELGREMVGPIVGKVYQCGLLYSLSLVAERFAMPANVTAVFLKRLTDGNGGTTLASNRRGNGPSGSASAGPSGVGANGGAASSAAGSNFYSVAVEHELAALLDVTLVRINERQEEQLMNDHVRAPILADPTKYNGIVTFMVRQLTVNNPVTGSAAGSRTAPGGGMLPMPKRIIRDTMASSNPYTLFHVLGLHDDEGSAASERLMDADNTTVRNQFHAFIITKYLAHATRGTMPPVPLPPSLGGVPARGAPIVRFDNAAAAQNGGMRAAQHDGIEASTSSSAIGVPNTGVGVGAGGSGASAGGSGGRNGNGVSSPSPVLPMPQGVTPALLRVLEYMIALASKANRELLLRAVFHPKSQILHFIEGACDTLCCVDGTGGRCLVGLDVLCGCVRFLKTVLIQMSVPRSEPDESPLHPFVFSPDPLSAVQTTAICRQLTVERDTFGYLLKAYNKLGGVRRNTVFHSSLLSVLEIISRCPTKEPEEKSVNTLRDVRDFIFYKHITRLPEVFARRFRDSLLDEVSVRLGRESTHSPNNSVSVLSSTAGSELLRSSSKLRFVDEVEAISGGVDGTLVPASVMDPEIVASVNSADEKQRKLQARSTMHQWTSVATHSLAGGSPGRAAAVLALPEESAHRSASSSPPPPLTTRASPPLTIGISRPGGSSAGHLTLADSAAGSSSLSPSSSSSPPRADADSDPTAAAWEEALDINASSEGQPSSPTTAANGAAAVLKPTAPKNEKPPGRPRNFASVLDTPLKNGDAGSGKSRSMPNVTTGGLSPPASPEESGRLSRSGTVGGASPLTRANSSSEGSAQAGAAMTATTDNVLLPKIKKRSSASGKR